MMQADFIMPSGAMQKIGNPTWSRDELILALDLYFTHHPSIPGKSSSPITILSHLLNKMAGNSTVMKSPTFRNANGVYMKLMNFKSLDPNYTKNGKVGLKQVGRGDKAVWAEFAADPAKCSLAAKKIIASIIP